jgi:hypothetical protein
MTDGRIVFRQGPVRDVAGGKWPGYAVVMVDHLHAKTLAMDQPGRLCSKDRPWTTLRRSITLAPIVRYHGLATGCRGLLFDEGAVRATPETPEIPGVALPVGE